MGPAREVSSPPHPAIPSNSNDSRTRIASLQTRTRHPSLPTPAPAFNPQIRTVLSGVGNWWSLMPGQRSFGHHVRRTNNRQDGPPEIGREQRPSSDHLGQFFVPECHLSHCLQPASGLRRQPELCQQSAGVVIRMALQWLPTQSVWFRAKKAEVQLGGQ